MVASFEENSARRASIRGLLMMTRHEPHPIAQIQPLMATRA
jgi:hypothetical protein